MKVSSSSILSIALALNGALASPLRARDYAVVTVTELETKTIDVTLTTWVDPGQYTPTEVPTPTADSHEKNKNKNHVSTNTPSTTLSTLTPTTISTPSTSIPTTTSLPTTSLSTTTSIPTTTKSPTTLEKSTLPVPTTSISTPPVKIEPSTTAPTPAPTPQSGSKTPSAGGGTVYSGDATFYNTGLGSCGIVSHDTDCIAAIGAPLYDSQGAANPNNNPLCNKIILVSYNGGAEVPVTIVDRCPECSASALDLSPAAFAKIGADQSAGRVNVKWRFAS